ncbi:hypothetical protein RJ639_039472 [Escallonia herrerae]|uniref:Basic peroxidase n=1 Tax=Escallonia herrerae TaxID=1293975 RepID=A0AA88WL07_9ASTE|nr:hypothetical protein RJ639_039472 [Escallonia herrerae]
MKGGARNIAAILILCLVIAPSASASFWGDLGDIIFGPKEPQSMPSKRYVKDFTGGSDLNGKEIPKSDTKNEGIGNEDSPYTAPGFESSSREKGDSNYDWIHGGRPRNEEPDKHDERDSVYGWIHGERPRNEEPDKQGERDEDGPLRVGFYQETCPRAEEFVKQVISEASKNSPGIPAGILRLHLHDCFVTGCDASLLLDKTPSGEKTEKVSPVNSGSLRGFEVIDEVKTQLEKECPCTVSCADVLAFGARDSLNISGLPSYEVPAGRRDSLSSREADVTAANIPGPQDSIDAITKAFTEKGLTVEDMVVLTGGHSIGVAQCPNFAYRVRQPNSELDPRLNADIRSVCRGVNGKATMPIDSITEYRLDVEFYKTLLDKKGLLESDQKLAEDPRTSDLVRSLADDQDGWFDKLPKSMIRMGKIQVLSGQQGEIRKQCRFVN